MASRHSALASCHAGRLGYLKDVERLLGTVAGHYDSAWFIDHLQGDVLESWTTLTYLAARHPSLRWGHTVLAQTFRNPALVAKMGATLQFLSGGHFILGIGAGGQADEHRAYGYAFPPRPDPMPPIMVGAFKPQMLRLTARHADWWNVSSTGIKAYRAYQQEFERACAEIGRDPATVRRTWGGGCICAPTEAEVAELAAVRARRGPEYAHQVGEDFVGTPAQIIDQMRPFVELGVDYFMLDCGGFPQLTMVEMLIQEVLPAFNA